MYTILEDLLLLFFLILFLLLPGYERHHHVLVPGPVHGRRVGRRAGAVAPRGQVAVTF